MMRIATKRLPTYFFATLGIVLLIRIYFAASIPITDDEAYFYWWGKYLDFGYYDHTPMIGWWMYILTKISDHIFVLRLPTILLPSVLSLLIIDQCRRIKPECVDKAYLAGILYLVMPPSVIFILVTNDTPLILFMALSGYAFMRARQGNSIPWFVFCGIFLGLAFLSKYIAILLGISYIYLFIKSGDLRGLFWVALAALPFGLQNLIYNAYNCWNNVLFNAINRTQGDSISLMNILYSLSVLFYVFTPWVLWLTRRALLSEQYRFVTMLFVVPCSLLLVVGSVSSIGLHWVLGFVPFMMIFTALCLESLQLRKCIKYSLAFSLLHIFIALYILWAPVTWLPAGLQAVAFYRNAPLMVRAIENTLKHEIVMTTNYPKSAILGYYNGSYMPVFGFGNAYARHYDTVVDFRKYDGKTIYIFTHKIPNVQYFSLYFDKVEIIESNNELRFWLVKATGFNYSRYKSDVLLNISKKYYSIPSYLPTLGCPFLDRYGFINH